MPNRAIQIEERGTFVLKNCPELCGPPYRIPLFYTSEVLLHKYGAIRR